MEYKDFLKKYGIEAYENIVEILTNVPNITSVEIVLTNYELYNIYKNARRNTKLIATYPLKFQIAISSRLRNIRYYYSGPTFDELVSYKSEFYGLNKYDEKWKNEFLENIKNTNFEEFVEILKIEKFCIQYDYNILNTYTISELYIDYYIRRGNR